MKRIAVIAATAVVALAGAVPAADAATTSSVDCSALLVPFC
jgi:hypothetical protein